MTSRALFEETYLANDAGGPGDLAEIIKKIDGWQEVLHWLEPKPSFAVAPGKHKLFGTGVPEVAFAKECDTVFIWGLQQAQPAGLQLVVASDKTCRWAIWCEAPESKKTPVHKRTMTVLTRQDLRRFFGDANFEGYGKDMPKLYMREYWGDSGVIAWGLYVAGAEAQPSSGRERGVASALRSFLPGASK